MRSLMRVSVLMGSPRFDVVARRSGDPTIRRHATARRRVAHQRTEPGHLAVRRVGAGAPLDRPDAEQTRDRVVAFRRVPAPQGAGKPPGRPSRGSLDAGHRPDEPARQRHRPGVVERPAPAVQRGERRAHPDRADPGAADAAGSSWRSTASSSVRSGGPGLRPSSPATRARSRANAASAGWSSSAKGRPRHSASAAASRFARARRAGGAGGRGEVVGERRDVDDPVVGVEAVGPGGGGERDAGGQEPAQTRGLGLQRTGRIGGHGVGPDQLDQQPGVHGPAQVSGERDQQPPLAQRPDPDRAVRARQHERTQDAHRAHCRIVAGGAPGETDISPALTCDHMVTYLGP